MNNKLALTVGYAENLARDPRLPDKLQQAAGEAVRGARAATAIVQQLHSLTQLHETQWGPNVGPTIDPRQSGR
jgi:hypothetical protein